jgi:hypothetical protein
VCKRSVVVLREKFLYSHTHASCFCWVLELRDELLLMGFFRHCCEVFEQNGATKRELKRAKLGQDLMHTDCGLSSRLERSESSSRSSSQVAVNDEAP